MEIMYCVLGCLLVFCLNYGIGCNISNVEYTALQEFYDALNGPEWIYRGSGPIWFGSQSNPCDPVPWQGLTCGNVNACFIEEISLIGFNLTGSIPSSIGDFENATLIDLSYNHLHGSLPVTLGNLTSLKKLCVSHGRLEGTLPLSLFGLINLQTLQLNHNFLSGTLSSMFSNLLELQYLYLSGNHLSGTIPTELFSRKIQQIDIHNNNLTGVIPTALVEARFLEIFDCSNNFLHGTIPTGLHNMDTLSRLFVEQNQLTGTIPESLYACPRLKEVNVGFQNITGSISNAIRNMSSLMYFNAPFCNISGTVPEFPTSLIELALDSTHLSGTLPSSLFSMPNLKFLYLSLNNFVGSIPDCIPVNNSLVYLALDSNFLTGSVPLSLRNALHLRQLYLMYNSLNGSIENILEGTSLHILQLYNNYFSGSVPNLTNHKDIEYLDVSGNYLDGSLPEEIVNAHLINFFFDYNDLTGSLPQSIGNWKSITIISGGDNKLTGPIPASICSCTNLQQLYTEENYFSKSIPQCLFTLNNMQVLSMYDSLLTGTLPSTLSASIVDLIVLSNQLTGPIPISSSSKMQNFKLEDNSFTGTVPSTLFNEQSSYLIFEVSDNYLHGTIPSLYQATTLNYLNFYHNHFSGSLPYIGTLRELTTFYVDDNHLSGHINCFNVSNQPFLATIDISENELTGTLPESVFRLPGLQNFSAVENCIQFHVSDKICDAVNLLVLALDGLYTAPPCRFDLLNGNYALKYYATGSVPACIFSMPNLQTLHMSGNGIGGSLPADLTLSPSLQDISLSYNQLSGSIPYELQVLPIEKFDLSYNLFDGQLIQEIVAPSNANSTLYLNVNRLSGAIPSNLLDIATISILNSNIFECKLNRQQLPKYDNETTFYECGTTSLQTSMYVFISFGTVALVTFSLVITVKSSHIDSFKLALLNGFTYLKVLPRVSSDYYNINQLNKLIHNLRFGFCILTGYVAIVLMPVYIALSNEYSMFQYSYAWVVASVYLTGYPPALILLVFYCIFVVVLFLVVYKAGYEFREVDVWNNELHNVVTAIQKSYRHYGGLVGIAVFNMIFVLGVNVAYVIASTSLKPKEFVGIQILMAFFKFVWNDVIIRNMTNRLHHYSTSKLAITMTEERAWSSFYLLFNSYVLLFNTIIIPCCATAVVSSECLYNVYFKPSNVISTISYPSCASYATPDPGVYSPDCTEYTYHSFNTAFLPPFAYRYQCSSTLVTTYAVVYVYKFIWTAFVRPVAVLYLIRLDETLDGDSWILKYINPFLPKLKHMKPLGHSIKSYLFSSNQFCLRMVMYLSILATFGVMFPPLAMMICVSVVVQTYFTQLILGRFVSKQDDTIKKTMLAYLNQDAANTGVMFMKSVYVVGGPAAFFYAFFLFDTYGDVAGGKKALQLALPMFVFGIVCSVVFRWKVRSNLSTVLPQEKKEVGIVELRTRSASKPSTPVSTESGFDSNDSIIASPVHNELV